MAKKQNLKELIAKCDPDAPMPQELADWDNISPVGNEIIEKSIKDNPKLPPDFIKGVLVGLKAIKSGDLSEYEFGFNETEYLFNSPENAKRLNRSIEQIEKGLAKKHDLAALVELTKKMKQSKSVQAVRYSRKYVRGDQDFDPAEHIEVDSHEFIQEYLKVMFTENGIEGLQRALGHVYKAITLDAIEGILKIEGVLMSDDILKESIEDNRELKELVSE